MGYFAIFMTTELHRLWNKERKHIFNNFYIYYMLEWRYFGYIG